MWSIGTDVGLSDIQPETSTGTYAIGTNEALEGFLKNNQTYYVTVTCTNGAGLKTTWTDEKGVGVLLVSPDPDKVKAEAVNAETFDVPVSPATALKSEDPNGCGQSFEVSDDPTVSKYVFCVGSTDDVIDDILPCVWVSTNTSGVVEIKNGYLQMDGVQYYRLSELKVLSSGSYDSNVDTSSGPSDFNMEIGRTIFLYLKLCNLAERCTTKLVNTLVITNQNTQLGSSTNGGSISASLTSTGRRRRRATEVLNFETPSGVLEGQTLAMNILTDTELNQTYTSDASTNFVSYLTNPNITLEQVDRILYGRIQSVNTYFAVSPVGQLALPGPMNVTFAQTKFNPAPDEETVMLIHWNPDYSVWQLTSDTCKEDNITVYDNEADGTSIALVFILPGLLALLYYVSYLVTRSIARSGDQVCNTRLASSVMSTKNTNLTSYFYKETQFGVAVLLGGVVNNAPNMTGPFLINITEDSVSNNVQLEAADEEGDIIVYSLVSGGNSDIGTVMVNSSGLISISPCPHCYGSVEVVVILSDRSNEAKIPASSSTGTIQITVTAINDPPIISLFSDNSYVLLPDPSEAVMIYEENNNETGLYLDIGMLILYDVDGDSLVINTTIENVNGTFTLTEATVEDMQNTIACNNSMCLNQSVPNDINIMGWKGLRISYNATPDFYGQETIKLVGSDTSGTLSDVVTVIIVLMINKCENGGVCLSLDPSSYGCNDVRRTESFDSNYTCSCTQSWTGSYCENDVDECAMYDPCEEFETCTDYMGRYECACDDMPCTIGLAAWQFALIIIACVLLLAAVMAGVIFRYKSIMKAKRRNMYPRELSRTSLLSNNKVHPTNETLVEPCSPRNLFPEQTSGAEELTMNAEDGMGGEKGFQSP